MSEQVFRIWNGKAQCFQFPSIGEPSKSKAIKKLFKLIGYDACNAVSACKAEDGGTGFKTCVAVSGCYGIGSKYKT